MHVLGCHGNARDASTHAVLPSGWMLAWYSGHWGRWYWNLGGLSGPFLSLLLALGISTIKWLLRARMTRMG